ncbi:hypothetical protein RHMOL_Rhmol04G0278600 [Rhododendron molle]|uniref:Uncharacterized protein n=1 Tax=Rhododendron molle TaxID=49168 RepID=A0ACC0P5D9_RHOML|nr:hypothetical protein RHMOL_Rhmol04G0278600 [Rhododendron molle]
MDSIISMYNATGFPFATSTIFVAFATFAATMKLIRSMTNDMLPSPAQSYLESALHYLITPTWNRIMIIVNEFHDDMISRNQVYDGADAYLRTKINPFTKRLRAGKTPQQSSLNVSVDKGQEILDSGSGGGGGAGWGSINLDHPATFETLGMDPELKAAIVEDLRGFLGGKEFYRKVGKARQRCYMLYGPPGTGKSSLIATMADYLKFDVYDLELTSLSSNSELRSWLMSTANRSIVVIRDVDCCVGVEADRLPGTEQPYEPRNKVSLSCLFSFIDGLWLSCGDERIIVFTTNYSYRLDPALSCPGRVDMHIHMSYYSSQVFKLLASNYLGVNDRHALFGEMENLLENDHVTVDQVAEELRKSENADIALRGVVNLLKRKKMEAHEIEQDRNRWTRRSVDGKK